MLDIVIIGAGPVGLFSAFYAGLRNFSGIVLEADDKIGGQLNLYKQKDIFDIPGLIKTTAEELINRLYQQYQTYQELIPIHFQEEVIDAIQNSDNTFTLKTKKAVYHTKTILITSGSGRFIPRKLDVDGANDFANITYKIADLESYRNQKVAILGGGDSALDWSLALANIASHCYIVHRREEFRAHEASVEQLKNSNVEIVTPFLVNKIGGNSQLAKLHLVNPNDGSTRVIEAEKVIVNYGTIPSGLGAIDQLGITIDKQSAILISTDCATNVKGIFAAGNSVEYLGKVKTLACGFGEVPIAINAINKYLNPGKNIPFIYSSLKK